MNELTKCPDCGGTEFLFGPQGGLSQDVLCVGCGQEFCDLGPFGLERLARDESRAVLYGLDVLPNRTKRTLRVRITQARMDEIHAQGEQARREEGLPPTTPVCPKCGRSHRWEASEGPDGTFVVSAGDASLRLISPSECGFNKAQARWVGFFYCERVCLERQLAQRTAERDEARKERDQRGRDLAIEATHAEKMRAACLRVEGERDEAKARAAGAEAANAALNERLRCFRIDCELALADCDDGFLISVKGRLSRTLELDCQAAEAAKEQT